MPITDLNKDLLVVCHCYAGDRQQVLDLLPVMEHHEAPIVIISPVDSPVTNIGPHICRFAGERAYIGQKSWDRQYKQLKALLDYPQKWFLLNDSDSFCITPKLPEYLFRDDNTVWSNEVDDFRKPGEVWTDASGSVRWPLDYHKGLPLIAMQPPYFLGRKALEAIVKTCEGLVACPTTPFIDWWWVPACDKAHVKHQRYVGCASCETVTPLGIAVMSQCVRERSATFLHSIKNAGVRQQMQDIFNAKR